MIKLIIIFNPVRQYCEIS